MPEGGSKTTVPVVWATFGFFSARSKWLLVWRDWWPWTKPGYITMTRRQSNNQWSGGIAAHLAPKNSECKNPLEKLSPRFFGIKMALFSLIIFTTGQIINAEYYSSLLMQLKGILKEKHRGKFTKGVFICTKMPRLTGHLQPRRNWPTWASNFLITQSIFWIWPRRNLTCSLGWKSIWKFAAFRLTRRSLLSRRPVWTYNFLNFFEWLAKVIAKAKKCIELMESMVNKSQDW